MRTVRALTSQGSFIASTTKLTPLITGARSLSHCRHSTGSVAPLIENINAVCFYKSREIPILYGGRASWTRPRPIAGAGCVRPRLLLLPPAGPLLMSGGRTCTEQTNDISVGDNTCYSYRTIKHRLATRSLRLCLCSK